MGCDIHTYTEVYAFAGYREDANGNRGDAFKTWQPADPWGVDPKYLSHDVETLEGEEGKREYIPLSNLRVPYEWQVYPGRNYNLFAALNNVRNYDETPSYFENGRPLPDDLSEIVAREFKAWGADAHSECWATLAELRQMRKWCETQEVNAWGVISKTEMKKLEGQGHRFWRTGEQPRRLSIYDTGEEVYRTDKPLDSYARGMGGEAIQVTWKQTLDEYVGGGLDAIIRNLEYRRRIYTRYGDEIKDHEVRLIWWYDN